MIRFTLRQLRSSGLFAAAMLAGLLVALLVTEAHLVHLYDAVVATCRSAGDCNNVTSSFLGTDRGLQVGLDTAVVIVPCLVGLFWGAPLVARELESGTYRVAWTQGVTRLRWLAFKLGIVGAASMATAGLLSLMATWWSSSIDRVNMNMFTSFDQRDIVPIGYAAFGFVLGVLAGIVARHTLPAMIATLVIFVTTRLAIRQWVRPHLVTPDRLSSAITTSSIGFGSANGGPVTLQPGGPNIPNAWIYSSQFVTKSGQIVSPETATKLCPNLGITHPAQVSNGSSAVLPAMGQIQSVLQACTAKLSGSYRLLTTYQPSGHYWPMQWAELALYLTLAIGLAGICYWWIRRRIA